MFDEQKEFESYTVDQLLVLQIGFGQGRRQNCLKSAAKSFSVSSGLAGGPQLSSQISNNFSGGARKLASAGKNQQNQLSG